MIVILIAKTLSLPHEHHRLKPGSDHDIYNRSYQKQPKEYFAQ